MDEQRVRELLTAVADGQMNTEDALMKLRMEPFEDIQIAKLDHHRALRQGIGEVVYGAGKTPEQILQICTRLHEMGEQTIMVTRISDEAAGLLQESLPVTVYQDARIAVIGKQMEVDTEGTILVVTGGTSDIPVAEEAAVTAETLGNNVQRLYDVGVAGIHRLLVHTEDIMKANVIIAIAGMEGALASVVGGLADCPVIAVPTSVGYGTAFGGVTALLSMLNSCASGVSVVNIDNGFGAGYLASMINHKGAQK